MAGVAESELAIARVYAASLLELAEATGDADTVHEQLRELVAAAERQPAFAAFLTSPVLDTATRGATIERLFRGRLHDVLVSALQVLNRKERLGLLTSFGAAYAELVQERKGQIEVHVSSAAPLSDSARQGLRQAASRVTGKQAELMEVVDDSLIGGLVVRIGDQKFDLSVASRVRRMYEGLLDRVVREAHAGRKFSEG